MTFIFGRTSRDHLSRVHPDLRRVLELALSWGIVDFTVYESTRTKAEQNRLYRLGHTRVKWPGSSHNSTPSDASDVAPFIAGKISWQERDCMYLAGIILAAAKVIGVTIRWGGDWNRNGIPIIDQNFNDLVHYERAE